VLIATGLSMQYAGAAGWLLPAGSEAAANAKNEFFLMNFGAAVKWHNITALILSANFLFFIIGNIVTGNSKYYKIGEKGLIKNLYKQGRYYVYGIFKGEEHPFPVNEKNKFNPLQKVSYVLAMYVGMPLLILSGIAMFFPELIVNRIFNISGLLINDLIHITTGFILSLFMIIHIYTCTLGVKSTTLFKSMITGYHEVH
jgi:thiosulfate reductase cytochrome b subunit